VIQLYIDGLNNSDSDSLRACFHENAWWACTMPDGSLVQYPVAESIPDWVGPDFKKDWTHQIISVIQAGDVASVMLEMHPVSDPSGPWVDIHSMLRIVNVWKDMNKTATHGVRAAWASGLPGSEDCDD
jgi:hypothetical protein